MKVHFIFFWTDILIYLLLMVLLFLAIWTSRLAHWREPWQRIGKRKLGMIALVLLLSYVIITLLDSVHFRLLPTSNESASDTTSYQVQSLLDRVVSPLGQHDENTYSAPFSLYSSAKSTLILNGKILAYYPRLKYGGWQLKSPVNKREDIIKKVSFSLVVGFMVSFVLFTIFIILYSKRKGLRLSAAFKNIITGKTAVAWREILFTCLAIILLTSFIKYLSPYYHILGTNKIGGDVLYETLKSIRTGLVIGTLTTLVILPFAIFLGTEAGYFGGWRDDVIQYVYTTLSSVPGVLLISAAVLSLQVFISSHPHFFPTLESRADARLLALCVILGITSWTSLCRLLRAETLKLREMDYVKAAVTMGRTNIKIIWRHIIPNVMHIILITVVLDFSTLVLAEAVLSYVGVGVDPITPSWGNMINSARLDLAREPVVWWPLFAAFVFMFVLVLAANLFADAVRDAFDPRLRNEA